MSPDQEQRLREAAEKMGWVFYSQDNGGWTLHDSTASERYICGICSIGDDKYLEFDYLHPDRGKAIKFVQEHILGTELDPLKEKT